MAGAPEIRLKRAREAPAQADGVRVLVDRLWPRGVSKADLKVVEWLRELAPSNELRRWFGHDPERWDGFRERYFRELERGPEGLERLREILAEERRVTLVFDARDVDHNNAVALREFLER